MKKISVKIQNHVNVKTLSKTELGEITPAILLNRVSGLSQTNEHNLIEKNFYKQEYIEEKKLTLITEYSFEESSSKDHLQNNFNLMIQEIKKLSALSAVPVNLICENSDRFSRIFSTLKVLQSLISEKKLKIHFIQGKDNFSNVS